MRILLTNDDGVYAPGLRALRTELLLRRHRREAALIAGPLIGNRLVAAELEIVRRADDEVFAILVSARIVFEREQASDDDAADVR